MRNAELEASSDAPGPAGSPGAAADAVDRDARHSPGVHAALSVLEALVAFAPQSLSDLAGHLEVPKSSLLRVLTILVGRSWVVRREDGRYDLGVRALGLSAQSSEFTLVRAFRVFATELRARHNETVCLAVLDGDDSTYVALEETWHPVRLVTHVGSRTPAFAAASGRVILADRSPQVIAAQYAGRPLVTPTGRRLRGVEELIDILRAVRADGFASSEGDTAVGLHAISVPIRNAAGAVLAALTMCVPTSRMSPGREALLLADLRDAAARLSEAAAWLAAWNSTRPDAVPVRATRS